MVGARLTFSALALAPLLAGVSAHAADYHYPPPPPVYQPPPIIIQQPAVEFAGNWYLRGQIGYGMTQASQMSFDGNAATAAAGFAFDRSSVSDSYFIGAGVGYEWNSWLRFDATAEFRTGMKFSGIASYTDPITGFALDKYDANLRSYVFLANAYVDIGTWDCFTPFVGVGIGGAYNQFRDFTDFGIPTGGRGFGRDTAQWNFAWALYAGVTYNVSKTFKVDLSYRYLDYGSFSDTIDCVGGCEPITYHLKKLQSHDLMLAFRWTCCEVAPPPPRYVYQPPPPPPPLHSKG